MKIGAITPAYNEEAVISGTIRCLALFVDRHIVLVSERPYFGQEHKPDCTAEIVENLGAHVVTGRWDLDHYQRNLGIQMLQDCDWILTFDADEMMTTEELEKLHEFLIKCPTDAVAIRPEVYWKTTDYVLRPVPDFTPIIAVKPNVKFTHIRNIDSPHVLYPGTMHHLSWCAPKNIKSKILHYAHASDFYGAEWYKNEYENWTPGMDKAVLPTGIYSVEKRPLPDELKRLL